MVTSWTAIPSNPKRGSTIHRHGDRDANQCAADQHYQQLDNHNQTSPALEPALPMSAQSCI